MSKYIPLAILALWWSSGAYAALAAVNQVVDVPSCTKPELLGYAPRPDETQAHRQFPLPVISYVAGSRHSDDWGLRLVIRVNELGRVACYEIPTVFGKPETLTDERRSLLQELREWHYDPFSHGGTPVAAIVEENLAEQELPTRHIEMPRVPLDRVQLRLSRSGCFGTCPSYQIDIDGGGHAVYHGDGFVDVTGTHTYQIPPADVAQLVDSIRSKDLWSLKSAYRAQITDQPTYELTLTLGEERHSIEDYAGRLAGMPPVVTDFEDEVDRVGQALMWVHLNGGAVQHLKAEHFPFNSTAGAELLMRAVSDEDATDDDALLTLIQLGTPTNVSLPTSPWRNRKRISVLEAALETHRAGLIAPLIALGGLQTDRKLDQKKLDSAFRAAIRGGRLALVQQIWRAGGEGVHPALTYESVTEDKPVKRKLTPVTLLLEQPYPPDASWEGFAVAQWLIAKGCDMRGSAANGDTLLHIAAEADDLRFVQYLLAQGFEASTPGEFDLPALGGTHDEDVAMALLEAGTDIRRLDSGGRHFRRYAEELHWLRVSEWLTAHGD